MPATLAVVVRDAQAESKKENDLTYPPEGKFPLLEFLLRRERVFLGIVLALVTALCWLWIVVMARDMYGSMSGPAAWMMTSTWDGTRLLLLWAMWAVMMAAMMLPAAAPTLLLYLGAARAQHRAATATIRVYALAAGYLVVWGLFSIGATLLQRLLATRGLLTPMMEPASPVLGPALLVLAGVYQMTPLKHACLRACRSPLSFLMANSAPGGSGAFRLGIKHGVQCLGCCWALMLLLFAGGVMSLPVILALTGWVLVEKLLPFGERGAYLSGALLIATAAGMLLR